MAVQRGDSIGGFVATGRTLIGPAADLVELDDDSGLKHTAVAFHPEYRGHGAIGSALDVVVGFLQAPMVTGLVELVDIDRDQGAFVYPTGEAWSVAEVIRMLADLGESGGVRAGLELMYTVGQILVEAADVGESQGVYSHGGLTPWRIMLKRDGQVLVIGHALPQVEILQFHEDSRRVPREDSFRYCPPERIEAQSEDLSSDLFSLALIAFELMTGKPVYDGLVSDIRQQAARGEGSRRLFRFREVLPQSVRDVLAYAIKPERDDRYPSGTDFMESVRAVLSSRDAHGSSLMDLMQRISRTGPRTGAAIQALEGGKTQMLSKDQIQKMLEDEGVSASSDGIEGRSAGKAWSPPPDRGRRRSRRDSRSERVSESSADVADPTPVAAPAAPAADDSGDDDGPRWSRGARRSRRSRGAGGDDEPPRLSPAAPQAPDPTRASGERARDLLDRIRSSGATPSRSGDAPSAADLIDEIVRSSDGRRRRGGAPPEVPGGDDGRPRFTPGRTRRSRRSGGEADGPPPIPGLGGGPRPRPAALETLTPPGDAKPFTAPQREVPTPEPAPTPGPAPTPAPPAAPTPAPPRPAAPVLAPPAEEAPTHRAPVPQGPAPTPVAAATVATRPPTLTQGGGGGEPVTFQLRTGPGQRPLKLRLPGGLTVAEAVARLIGHPLPLRTDLSGGLAGWWRLARDGQRLAATATLADVADGAVLDLVLVDNDVRRMTVSGPTGDGTAAVFVAPVGVAVPAATLADHLAGLLDLPGGSWAVQLGDRVLGPHELLADHPAGGVLHLVEDGG